MRTFALTSGSSGNSFYVENEKTKEAVLIDLGISCKRTVKILNENKINPENIKGIFITHEHSDHIQGVDVFSRAFGVPVFLTKGTHQETFVCSDDSLINLIKNNENVKIAGLDVQAFSKPHDCKDPVSYSVSFKEKTLSVITDIGHANKNVVEAVSESDLLFIESNHDIDMLKDGPYPDFLKKRIMGDQGHFSNFQSALCLLEHANKKLKTIVLSHLSIINNTPNIALKTIHSLLKERRDLKLSVSVSERDQATDIFQV